MSHYIEEKIVADITCSICLELYTRPLTLIPCLHSYCKHCLACYVKSFTDDNGKFPCPECRFEITLPSKGVDGFPHNHTLQSIIDSLTAKKEENGKETANTNTQQPIPKAVVNSTENVDLSSFTIVNMVDEDSPKLVPPDAFLHDAIPHDPIPPVEVPPETFLCVKLPPENVPPEKVPPEKQQDINTQTNTISEISTQPEPASTPPTLPVSLPPLPTMPCSLPIMPCALPTVPCALPTVPCALPTVPCALPTVPGVLPTVPGALPSAPLPNYNLYPNLCDQVPTCIPKIPFCAEGLLAKFGRYSSHVNDFQKPYGIAINRAGNICVSDLKGGRILIFSPLGEYIKKIVPSCNIYDIAILPKQQILTSVSNTDKSIMHSYDMEGHLISQYTGLHFQYAHPSGVAVNREGYAIVTSLENDCVYTFTEEGKLSQKFGWKGSGNVNFIKPYFVTTNQKSQIIVSDFGNNCIKMFSKDGKFKAKYGQKGKDKGMLFKPMGVCTDENNNIIVADFGNYRVQVFSPKGRSLGFPVYDTFRIGQNVSPFNVAVDRYNNIVVLLTGDKFAEIRIYQWNPEEV